MTLVVTGTKPIHKHRTFVIVTNQATMGCIPSTSRVDPEYPSPRDMALHHTELTVDLLRQIAANSTAVQRLTRQLAMDTTADRMPTGRWVEMDDDTINTLFPLAEDVAAMTATSSTTGTEIAEGQDLKSDTILYLVDEARTACNSPENG